MEELKKIDIENAYFHGLAGGIPFWDEDRVKAIALGQLRKIIEYRGIYSRRILREKYDITYDEKDPVYNGDDYISVCIKNPEDSEFEGMFRDADPAFFRYVRFKIGIALNNNIVNKYKFRTGEYEHLPGERQILDFIDISDCAAIVVGVENKAKIIQEIEGILEGVDIPITDINGNVIKSVKGKEDNYVQK